MGDKEISLQKTSWLLREGCACTGWSQLLKNSPGLDIWGLGIERYQHKIHFPYPSDMGEKGWPSLLQGYLGQQNIYKTFTICQELSSNWGHREGESLFPALKEPCGEDGKTIINGSSICPGLKWRHECQGLEVHRGRGCASSYMKKP